MTFFLPWALHHRKVATVTKLEHRSLTVFFFVIWQCSFILKSDWSENIDSFSILATILLVQLQMADLY